MIWVITSDSHHISNQTNEKLFYLNCLLQFIFGSLNWLLVLICFFQFSIVLLVQWLFLFIFFYAFVLTFSCLVLRLFSFFFQFQIYLVIFLFPAVALYVSLPFVGFGFLDNFLMIVAGSYIDIGVGAIFTISTMGGRN